MLKQNLPQGCVKMSRPSCHKALLRKDAPDAAQSCSRLATAGLSSSGRIEAGKQQRRTRIIKARQEATQPLTIAHSSSRQSLWQSLAP